MTPLHSTSMVNEHTQTRLATESFWFRNPLIFVCLVLDDAGRSQPLLYSSPIHSPEGFYSDSRSFLLEFDWSMVIPGVNRPTELDLSIFLFSASRLRCSPRLPIAVAKPTSCTLHISLRWIYTSSHPPLFARSTVRYNCRITIVVSRPMVLDSRSNRVNTCVASGTVQHRLWWCLVQHLHFPPFWNPLFLVARNTSYPSTNRWKFHKRQGDQSILNPYRSVSSFIEIWRAALRV